MNIGSYKNTNSINFSALRVPGPDVMEARQMLLDAKMGIFSKLEVGDDILILSQKEDGVIFAASTFVRSKKAKLQLNRLKEKIVKNAQNLTLQELAKKIEELQAIQEQYEIKFAEIFGKQ